MAAASRTSAAPLTRAVVLASLFFTGGCVGAIMGGSSTPESPEGAETAVLDGVGDVQLPDEGIPTGFGTLRQDQVALSLRSSDLLIQVTPLDPSVIRVLATDTWERLRDLREGRAGRLQVLSGRSDPSLFLVSLFSYEQDVSFEPEDLNLINRGLRFRPLGIAPVTPGWGLQRLTQEVTQMAIYAFEPSLDLEQEIQVEYLDARSGGWNRILRDIQAERGRVLARARSSSGG